MAYGISREVIRPDSPLHNTLRQALDMRWVASAQRMDRLHRKWRQSEDQWLAYLPEREVDAKRRIDRELGGKPQYTTLVLPYSYAMLMAAHSYWTTVFLGRSPIMQFTGRHGESMQAVQAIEALIDYQMYVGKALVPLHLWLLDPGKFGVGILGLYWDDETITTSQVIEEPEMFLGVFDTGKMRKRVVTQQVPGYSGNRLYNIRPYDYYPDPRVALWEVQKGEFAAVYREVGWNQLVRGEQNGSYFNVDVLRSRRQQGEFGYTAREQGSPRTELPNDTELYDVTEWDLKQTGQWGIVEFYVDLIPKEWKLGPGTSPEKWCFTATVRSGPRGINQGRGNLDTLIGARPLGALHNQFPFCILLMEPEAYAMTSRSMLEVIKPLQDAMDWLFNSHAYNVRKTMNNQLVVDPSRVVMGDITDPLPGGLIRGKPAGYGTDLRTAVHQLDVTDVTAGHPNFMQFIDIFGQKATGVNEQLQGMIDQGGRKTAQEIRASSTFGVNRQKTNAEFFSAMGFGPLGDIMVANTQQYYQLDRKYKIAGDLMLDAGPATMRVDPSIIAGNFDFVPVDGTLPIDRYAMANLWREMMQSIVTNPLIAPGYDIARMFAWVAQLAGLKNIHRFRVDIMPDTQAQMMAAQGNIVPLRPGAGAAPAGIPEPGQISGMGQTA